MPIFTLIFILVVIGVGMWAVNTYLGPKMQPSILTILNIAVVIAVILWLASVFGLIPGNANIHVGR
jgi:fumarate reductase subunit C